MNPKYLVTGGAGFIGSHIIRRLLREGGKVRVVDNLVTGDLERLSDVRSAVEFQQGDLADPRVCEQAVAGVDYVLHQAAIPSVQRSINDPVATNRANINATLNLLESARKAGIKKFVYAASSSAYGDTETLPKQEAMAPNPLSPYALQKLVGEQYCRLYHQLFGVETVCLRYFNVFGPGQDPNSEYSAVIPKFINRMLKKDRLTVFGDGEQSRDFTYVENVVDANLLALQASNAAGKLFNIACGKRVTLNGLIEKLEAILDLKTAIDYLPRRVGDVRHSLADIGLARKLLGYEPTVGLEEGLGRTVEWMRKQKTA